MLRRDNGGGGVLPGAGDLVDCGVALSIRSLAPSHQAMEGPNAGLLVLYVLA